MDIRAEHEIHQRRLSRNVGLGLVLVGFVALVYFLTIAKVNSPAPNTLPAAEQSQ
ncbi:hypothetical protein [Aliiroseovarius subalbicans]|uniref:hypothetical protein n=1 Tax=Aliiroseovarius subalbicans TaxID=2925840 RepID=UPI001F55C0C1|nr:hypothetical protein [Aliiroseovarius subalbicans]MCI2398914.1 hypothetical protein [Aliiroseovarius subalbicans]